MNDTIFLFKPTESDILYCYPPWAMRKQVTEAVLKLAKKAILVLPVFDKVTAEYSFLASHFDYVTRIGMENKMVIRVSRGMSRIQSKLARL